MITSAIPLRKGVQEGVNKAYLFLPQLTRYSYPIEFTEQISLGRSPANMLCLEDHFISSHHARIERKPKGYLLRDLRSRNGTYVNGVPISEAWLSEQDRIRIGKTELIFSYHAEQKKYRITDTSRNPFWQEQLSRIPDMAQSELPVLIIGPSGSGKEVLARQLHNQSLRNEGPFISVNCSALGESLVESELFGHRKGSFTGANHDRKGAFESARSGTLFLDELGDLPLNLQPKLLRALENQEIRPVGSDSLIQTDVRILAATHQNLKSKVMSGEFRADLFFRLNVLSLTPPPLYQRMEDFENLLYHFGKEYKVSFSQSAILELKKHHWPGNIRELKNFVARSKALFSDRQITTQDLSILMDKLPDIPVNYGDSKEYKSHSPRSPLKTMEKELIIHHLISNGGNQTLTAAELGIAKSTLHDRLRRYGVKVKDLMKNHKP